MDTLLVFFFNDAVSSTMSLAISSSYSLVSHLYLYGVLLDRNFLSMSGFHTHPYILSLLKIALRGTSHFLVVARIHNHSNALLCYPLVFKATLAVLFSEISVSSKGSYSYGIFCLLIVLGFILILLMTSAVSIVSIGSLNVKTSSALLLAMVVTTYLLTCVCKMFCLWVIGSALLMSVFIN